MKVLCLIIFLNTIACFKQQEISNTSFSLSNKKIKKSDLFETTENDILEEIEYLESLSSIKNTTQIIAEKEQFNSLENQIVLISLVTSAILCLIFLIILSSLNRTKKEKDPECNIPFDLNSENELTCTHLNVRKISFNAY